MVYFTPYSQDSKFDLPGVMPPPKKTRSGLPVSGLVVLPPATPQIHMIAVIGNLVVALLALSLFTATLRLSR